MSFNEFLLYDKAEYEKLLDQYELAITQAWYSALFTNSKELPKLEKFIPKREEEEEDNETALIFGISKISASLPVLTQDEWLASNQRQE